MSAGTALDDAPAAAATTSPAPNPCQAKLDRLRWVMGDVYRIHDVEVEIRTTSPRFASWMAHSFQAYRSSGEPDARLSVAIGEEGPEASSIHTLYRGIVPIVRSRHVSTLARGLVDELESFSFPVREDAVFVSATLVEIEGSAVLIPSYLAPYLSRSRRVVEQLGIRMSSGPAVAVDARGRVGRAEKALRLPKGATSRMAGDRTAASELVDVRRRRAVDAVCWFSRAATEPVAPVSRARALYAMASDAVNLQRVGGRAVDVLSRLLEGAECFELRGDTPRSMLLALASAVRGGDPQS